MSKALARAVLICSLPTLFMPSVPARDSSWAAQARYVMGTLLEVQLRVDEDSADKIFTPLFAIARRCDEVFSTYKPDSPVPLFNRRRACQSPFIAPEEMIVLTSISQNLNAQTGGAFDITVGPLVRLWQEAARKQRWPEEYEIRDARARVGITQLTVDREARTITPAADGVEVDFNGIAKGYCVDEMVRTLHDEGVYNALINFGESSVFALGVAPDGRPWSVAVRDPKRPDSVAFNLSLSGLAIGSSASYEKSNLIAGRKVNHIIDPRTGMPADSRVAVTVIAPSATLADALSTALAVLPPAEGIKVLEKFPGAHAVIFHRLSNGRWQRLLSPGMERFID